jgi:small subunit ribosomal protein S16
VGHVNPLTEPATISLKEERIVHWLQVGAQPSETAAKLLTRAGVMEKAGKAPVVYQGKEVPPAEKGKKAEAEAAAPAPAPEASAAPAEEPSTEPEAPAEAEAPAEESAPEEAASADAEPNDETPTEDTETTD